MTDWLPEICKIDMVEPHPNADRLDILTVMGYPVIETKGNYKEGDIVSYIPYDSIVPDTDDFYFLCPKDKQGKFPVGSVPEKYRTVKPKKIRGVYSEGILRPAPNGFNLGDSVIEYFGLTKRVYEEEREDLETNTVDGGNEASPVKLFKYDLWGVNKYSDVFAEGEEVIITEKLEGENCCFLYTNDRLYVRSRQHFKRESDQSRWWDFPHRVNLADRLKIYPNLCIWGEIYGGSKGQNHVWNYDCAIENKQIIRNFRVFDIFSTVTGKFLEWSDVERISAVLELPTVPVLYRGPWKSDKSLYELAEGKSVIGECVREGWVMRSLPESWATKMGRKIIKCKGKGYKLAKG